MSYGISLSDPNGFEFLRVDDSSDPDDQFILILDSFPIYAQNSGNITYTDIKGGSTLGVMLMPLDDSYNPPDIEVTGATITWTGNVNAAAADQFILLVSVR